MIRTASLAAALLFLAGPALAQDKRCGADKDCPGAAVCENGACVERPLSAPPDAPTVAPLPAPPAAPAAPATSPSPSPGAPASFQPGARRTAIKVDPLVPLAFLAVSALSSSIAGAPVLVIALPVEVEYALTPNVSLTGVLTPLYLSIATTLSAATTTGFGGSLSLGARYYFSFSGAAPNGFFAGGALGLGFASVGLPTGLPAPDVGFDAQAQFGYQWVFDSGFTLALIGTWSPVAIATTGRNGLGFQLPLGFAF